MGRGGLSMVGLMWGGGGKGERELDPGKWGRGSGGHGGLISSSGPNLSWQGTAVRVGELGEGCYTNM